MKRDEIISLLNLSCKEDGMCQYKDYDILVFDYTENFMTYPFFIMRFNQNIEKEQVKTMSSLLKGFGNVILDKCGYIINIPCIFLTGKIKAEKAETIKQKFDDFINYLQTSGIETLSTCILCRQQKEDELLQEHKINNLFVLAHQSCFEEYKNHFINEISKNETNVKAYPLSILLSFLGAAAGFIINLIIMLITNYLFALAFMLIPLGAFYGFKLGKAPINKKTMIITSIISILVILGSSLGINYLAFLGALTENSDLTFIQFLKENINFMVFSVLFGFFGIITTFGLMKRQTNENKLNSLN